ncbi:cobalamin biosynthesis protein CobW [Nonomuraea mesophila]|uniref:Cobalamin biosynthesis protein CobW n=1 Tax=Nonomuraea mesophila TaxID=2530382 RepID=A0A4R5FSY8_9ACTN|nr:GTP-binding protein [Nonomuraea mesophila]TDE56549.1 cobalamin biosynthesis protein CobW [Nonomuraea mesophila]
MPIPVALVGGLYGCARAEAVDRLLRRHPGAVAVSHGITAGQVERAARASAGAPLLIIDLWDSVEPRPAAEALARAGHLRLASVHTALDAGHLPVDICRGDRLAPYTPIVTVPDPTGPTLDVRELAERVDPATAQFPADGQTGEVTTVVWHRLRPLHPGRLFDVMDQLVTTTVRSRGRFWLANRHERMLAWDAVAGAVSVRDAGPWLAALTARAQCPRRPPAARGGAARPRFPGRSGLRSLRDLRAALNPTRAAGGSTMLHHNGPSRNDRIPMKAVYRCDINRYSAHPRGGSPPE